MLETVAVARDMTVGSFAKRQVLRALKHPLPETARRRSAIDHRIVEATGQLGRIGNNANQMARIANAKGELPTAQILDEIISELRAIRASLVGDPE